MVYYLEMPIVRQRYSGGPDIFLGAEVSLTDLDLANFLSSRDF